LTSIYGIYGYKVNTFERIETALKIQLLLSTVLTLIGLPVIAIMSLPDEWSYSYNGKDRIATRWYAVIATSLGLVSGFLIGMSTDYYTSNSHDPVIEMAHACESGAAINIIYGLAIGYLSTIIPIILLSITIIISITLCGLFGVALAAIGMLSTLCVGLAIDAYGPISDNAGGIV